MLEWCWWSSGCLLRPVLRAEQEVGHIISVERSHLSPAPDSLDRGEERIPVSSIQYLIFEVNRSTSGELVEKAPFLSVGTGVSWTAPGQGCGMGVFHWRLADCTEQQYLCGERMSNQQEETGDKPL